MKNIVRITFKNEIEVEIENAEELTKEELFKAIEESVIAKIKERLPAYVYSIHDADVLTFSNVKPGIVIDAGDNGYGIVTKVNKKTINVSTKDGAFQGPPTAFGKVDDEVKIEDIMWERGIGYKQRGDWNEGNTGYLVVKDDIHKVVLVYSRNDKYNALVINGNGASFGPVTEQQLDRLMYDTLEEAQNKTRKVLPTGSGLTLREPPERS